MLHKGAPEAIERNHTRDIAVDIAMVAGALLFRLALFEGPIEFKALPQGIIATFHLLCVFASSRYLAVTLMDAMYEGFAGKLARGLAVASMIGLIVMPYGMLLSLNRVPEWFGVKDGVASQLLFACIAALWGIYSASPSLVPPLHAIAEHLEQGGRASGKSLATRIGDALKDSRKPPLFFPLTLLGFMALGASLVAVGQEDQLLALALVGIVSTLAIIPLFAVRALKKSGLGLAPRASSVIDGALIGAAGALWQGFVLYGLTQHVTLMLLASGLIPVRILALFQRGQGVLARLSGIVGLALLVVSGL